MQKPTILVTGGAGYIGSHVVTKLGEQGFNIVVVDNLSTGREKSVLFGTLIKANLEDVATIDKVFSDYKPEAVLHFAGSIVVPESVSKPLEYYSNNTANSHRLLELCKKHKVNRFVFSSTASVYGIPDVELVDEETPVNPINPYGRSKLMTEWMLEDFAKTSDFNYIALRYFNVSGADLKGRIGQCFPGATHLIKVSCEAALGKRNMVNIFGTDYPTKDGTGIRDYIHIEDLAQAHVDAVNYLFKNNQSHVLNCGYGQGYSVREVINMVKKVSGVDFKVEEAPRRPGDPPRVVTKADKIKKIIGFNPKYNDLELIVKTAFEWEKKI